MNELLQFLESRNRFSDSDNCSLRNIATGINAGIGGNVDTANEVGEKILTSMAQQNVLQHSFNKKDQASGVSRVGLWGVSKSRKFKLLVKVGDSNGITSLI